MSSIPQFLLALVDRDGPLKWQDQVRKQHQRDFQVQFVVSIVFGFSAFIAFCV
jgi:hypothetical protein